MGWRTVCAVEIEDYPRKVLLARQRDGILPRFPIWDDIRTFNGRRWRGRVDVVSGGFPCQKFSSAHHGVPAAEDMSAEFARVVNEAMPSFVFAENVSARAIGELSRRLRGLGYLTNGLSLSAEDVGADHRRRRYWSLSYTDINSQLCLPINAEAPIVQELPCRVWETGPDEFRVDDGVAHRVDRIKAIGNGQVPAVAALAWDVLSQERYA